MANRLAALRPRLSQHYQQVAQQEDLAAYRARRDELAPERDALEQELADTYQVAVAKLVDLFGRIRDFQQRAQQALGNPPSGLGVLSALDGVRLLDKIVLPHFEHPGRNIWPKPSTFSASFAQQGMSFDRHPEQFWSDPEIQERRRAE